MWKSGTLIKILTKNEHAWKSTLQGDTWTNHNNYATVNNKTIKVPQNAQHIKQGTVVLFLKGKTHSRFGTKMPGMMEIFYLHKNTTWKTVAFVADDLHYRYELCKKKTISYPYQKRN